MLAAAAKIAAKKVLLRLGAPQRVELDEHRMYILVPRHADQVPVSLAGPNRFVESDASRGYRGQVALELMDGDVYGFMLLMLKQGKPPKITFRAQTDDEWRDAFLAAIGRVAVALVD